MEYEGFDREEARRLFAYTQEVFFSRPRPITGLEDRIRAPPIVANFEHLERICRKFDLPVDIFYDNKQEVDLNWRNFYEFLLDDRVPSNLKRLSGETYPVLRTVSQLYESIKDFDLPRNRYPYKSEDLGKQVYLYVMRTAPYTSPDESEQVEMLSKALFMTRDDLASRSGLTKNYITRLEKGNSKLKWEHMNRLGKALGVYEHATGTSDFCEYKAHRLDKRFRQFLSDTTVPSFSRDRLPRVEHIHPDLKYSVTGMYFLLKHFKEMERS